MAKAIALAIFPPILLCLPADFFDHGADLCLFTRLSGMNCWGCGLTRACMHLIHLDLGMALTYNKISFIVLPILSGLTLQEFLKSVRQYKAAIRQEKDPGSAGKAENPEMPVH